MPPDAGLAYDQDVWGGLARHYGRAEEAHGSVEASLFTIPQTLAIFAQALSASADEPALPRVWTQQGHPIIGPVAIDWKTISSPSADELLGQRVRDDQRLVARRTTTRRLLDDLSRRSKMAPEEWRPSFDADPPGFVQAIVELARARLIQAHYGGVLFPTLDGIALARSR